MGERQVVAVKGMNSWRVCVSGVWSGREAGGGREGDELLACVCQEFGVGERQVVAVKGMNSWRVFVRSLEWERGRWWP